MCAASHTDSQSTAQRVTAQCTDHSLCTVAVSFGGFPSAGREPRDFRESGTRLTETQRPDLEGRYVMLAETARDASDSESGLVVAD